MKKKHLIILIAIALIIIVLLVLRTIGNTLMMDSISFTEVTRDSFRQQEASQNTASIILDLESSEGLLLNQKGNLTIPLQSVSDVWTVKREALLERSEGYYLLRADWVNRKDRRDKYLVKVKVEMADDQKAVISGIGIENLKVCVIDDMLKELIDD